MDSHGSGSGRGRTRRRVAIGVVAATVALLAVTILPSSAASSVPQLKLTQTASGWTKVAWTFTSSDHAQDMQLQIDRGPDAAHFAKWLVINRPEKNSFRYDKDGKHTIVYRARLSVKGVFGGWSNPISLAGVGSTAPPSTPPTTTVKPTTTTVKPTTTTTTVPVTTHACSDAAKADVLRFINTERAKVGAKPLVMNTELAAAAQAHTAWMVKNNVMHSPAQQPGLVAERDRVRGLHRLGGHRPEPRRRPGGLAQHRVRRLDGEPRTQSHDARSDLQSHWGRLPGHHDRLVALLDGRFRRQRPLRPGSTRFPGDFSR
jgi:hypothetical protein